MISKTFSLFFIFFCIASCLNSSAQNNCFKIDFSKTSQPEPPTFTITFREISTDKKAKKLLLRQEKNISPNTFLLKNQEPNIEVEIVVMGFQTYLQSFENLVSNDTVKVLVPLILRNTALNEVVVKGKFERFVQTQDTLIVRLKDDDTVPHGSATSLFDRVPGLDNSFGLKVMGKKVDAVTVDGKRYFGGDSKLTLDNIKANMLEQMELIGGDESDNYTLNLTIKQNRKNGFYGFVGGAMSLSKKHLFESTINKIGNGRFFNLFVRSNDINQNWEVDRRMSSMGHNLLPKRSNLSFIDTETFTNLFILHKKSSPTGNRQIGENKISEVGLNYNFSKNKSEINVLLIGGLHKNFISENNKKIQSLGEFKLENFNINEQFLKQNPITASFIYKANPNKKWNIVFTNNFQMNGSKNTQNDSGYVIGLANQLSQNFHFLQNSNLQFISNNLQLGVVHKGNKIGKLSSLLVNSSLESIFGDKSFQNQYISNDKILNQKQRFDKRSPNNNLSIEYIYSMPYSKRWLFEYRQNFWVNSGQNIQQINSWNNNTPLYTFGINYKNIIYENSFFTLYQKKKLKILRAQTLYFSTFNRFSENLVFKNHSYIYSPTTKIEYGTSKRKIFLKFSRFPIIPSLNQMTTIPDSSNLNNLEFGNINLVNGISNKTVLSSSIILSNGLNINLSGSFSSISRPIINQSFFDNERGTLTVGYQNGNQPSTIKELTLNGFYLKQTTKFNLFFILSINKTHNYLLLENRLLDNYNSMFFSSFYSNFKLKKGWNFKVNEQFNIFKNNTTSRYQSITTANNTFELSKKTYSQIAYKINYTFGNKSNNYLQQALDIDFFHYVGKNNQFKVGLIGKNLLSRPFETRISSDFNQVTTNNINVVPRTILLSCTIYPELWK